MLNEFLSEDHYIPHELLDRELVREACKEVRAIDIEAFFEAVTGFRNCILFRTQFKALSYLVKIFDLREVYIAETVWPGLQSIMGLLKGSHLIRVGIAFHGKYFSEYIDHPLRRGLVILISLPSIIGSTPFNVHELSTDNTIIVDAGVCVHARFADAMIISLRRILPLHNVTGTILCSDRGKPCKRVSDKVYWITSPNEIIRRAHLNTMMYVSRASNTVNMMCELVPGTNYIAIIHRILRPRIHKPIYYRIPGLYGIIFSGLENMDYLREAVRELESSATPGHHIIDQ